MLCKDPGAAELCRACHPLLPVTAGMDERLKGEVDMSGVAAESCWTLNPGRSEYGQYTPAHGKHQDKMWPTFPDP